MTSLKDHKIGHRVDWGRLLSSVNWLGIGGGKKSLEEIGEVGADEDVARKSAKGNKLGSEVKKNVLRNQEV